MRRSLSAILLALLQAHGPAEYAGTIQKEAVEHGFDPVTLVAMAYHESRWFAGIGQGDCVGLVGVCSSNPERRAELLDGHENLRAAAAAIEANRKFCRKKTGSSAERHWLTSYQGLNRDGVWCGQRLVRGRWRDVPAHRITRRVLELKRALLRGAPPRGRHQVPIN